MRRYDNSRCTPVRDWPERDRQLWEKALAPADPFEPEVGYARRWADTTRTGIVNGYGRWLGCLERTSQLDPTLPPGDRATEERARDYLDMMRESGLADNTCAGRLQQLCNALRAMDRDRDWSWLHRASSRIYSKAVLVRDPVERMQPAEDVVQLGLDLMHAAVHDRFRTPSDRAILYRDGLIIALLVRRPFRMANFSAMGLGTHVCEQAGSWRIRFEGEATKGGEIIDCAWPGELLEHLRSYLDVHREVLLRSAKAHDGVQALWVARAEGHGLRRHRGPDPGAYAGGVRVRHQPA